MIIPLWLWIVGLVAALGVGATIVTTSVQRNATDGDRVTNTTMNNTTPSPSTNSVAPTNTVVPKKTVPKTTLPSVSPQIIPVIPEVNYNNTVTPYGQGPSDQ